jgi:catechol 2,3-dioxygenase-like lactoylglutathione lyase family enzyme
MEEDRPMIERMHHAAISTPDLERALSFYRDLVGFEVVSDQTWEKGTRASANAERIMALEGVATRAVMLQLGGTLLELFEFASPRPHICLQVSDLEAEYERLERAGMRFHCPPQRIGRGTTVTYGRDFDGNVVELLETKR